MKQYKLNEDDRGNISKGLIVSPDTSKVIKIFKDADGCLCDVSNPYMAFDARGF